jgi:hypothetical protein
MPAMHCSRTRLVDVFGNPQGWSMLFSRKPSFGNAIIQNIAAGNTIVMNRAAMDAFRRLSAGGGFVSHDWWAYMVITAIGGVIKYDTAPLTRYRQHTGNLVGENASLRARLARFRFACQGRFRIWNDLNLTALQRNRKYLTEENRQTVDSFISLRGKPFFMRPFLIHRAGIHRQSRGGQFSLYLACLLGKI